MKKKQKNNRFFMVMKSEIQKDLKAIIKKKIVKMQQKHLLLNIQAKYVTRYAKANMIFLYLDEKKKKE